MKLDTNDATPLYVQLKNELLQAINTHVYQPGEQIPAELELSEQYGVSRITVRQAVQALCEDGYLVKKQGKGTFVQSRRISRKLDNMMSFTKSCNCNGLVPSSTVLECAPVKLTRAEQALFHVSGDQQYLRIKRLRLADGIPVSLDTCYFPLPQYSFLQREDLSGSLYQVLKKHGVYVHATRDVTLDVVLSTRALAQEMHISAGCPMFFMVEKAYDRDEALIHLATEYIVGEHYRYSLEDYIVKDEDYDGI